MKLLRVKGPLPEQYGLLKEEKTIVSAKPYDEEKREKESVSVFKVITTRGNITGIQIRKKYSEVQEEIIINLHRTDLKNLIQLAVDYGLVDLNEMDLS